MNNYLCSVDRIKDHPYFSVVEFSKPNALKAKYPFSFRTTSPVKILDNENYRCQRIIERRRFRSITNQ